jgi:hypothetical protein
LASNHPADISQKGTVLGMGHSVSYDEAIYNAKLKALLILKMLQNSTNNYKHKNNLAKGDADFFTNLFKNNNVLNLVEKVYKFKTRDNIKGCNMS